MSEIHLYNSLATLTQLSSQFQHSLKLTDDYQPVSAPADNQFYTGGAEWAWAHLLQVTCPRSLLPFKH